MQPPAGMTEHTPWEELRRIADELELKIHLGNMEARDRWRAIKPRLVELEHRAVHSGEQAVEHELAEIRTALHQLRDDLYARVRGDYVAGW